LQKIFYILSISHFKIEIYGYLTKKLIKITKSNTNKTYLNSILWNGWNRKLSSRKFNSPVSCPGHACVVYYMLFRHCA
jgi:hypothetical protein